MANSNPSDDCLLQAVQYLGDDLSPGERKAFERLLDESQSAREAVAEAVELTRAIHAAAGSSGCAPAAPGTPHTSTAWKAAAAAAALAACLMLAVVANWVLSADNGRQLGNRNTGNRDAGDSTTRMEDVARDPAPRSKPGLAAEWSKTLERLSANDSADWNAALPSASIELENIDDTEEGAVEPLAAPSWMLAAVCQAELEASTDDLSTSSPPQEN